MLIGVHLSLPIHGIILLIFLLVIQGWPIVSAFFFHHICYNTAVHLLIHNFWIVSLFFLVLHHQWSTLSLFDLRMGQRFVVVPYHHFLFLGLLYCIGVPTLFRLQNRT